MQFLYMARRDKFTVEFISTSDSKNKDFYKRNLQVNQINLNNEQKFQLEKIYYPNRMDWELIVEEAADINQIRDRLRKRGYKYVPTSFYHQIPKSQKVFLAWLENNFL